MSLRFEVRHEALVEFQLASELNPANPEIEDALSSVKTQLRNKVAVARDGKTAQRLLDAHVNKGIEHVVKSGAIGR